MNYSLSMTHTHTYHEHDQEFGKQTRVVSTIRDHVALV